MASGSVRGRSNARWEWATQGRLKDRAPNFDRTQKSCHGDGEIGARHGARRLGHDSATILAKR